MLAMGSIVWGNSGELNCANPGKAGRPRKEKTPGTLAGRAFQSESGRLRGLRIRGGGAGNRNRTYDLRITNAPLYQLSYSGGAANFRGWGGGGSMRGCWGWGGKPLGSRGVGGLRPARSADLVIGLVTCPTRPFPTSRRPCRSSRWLNPRIPPRPSAKREKN